MSRPRRPSARTRTLCEHTTTTAALYGFDDAQGCWAQIGSTQSKQGVHPPTSGLVPALCSDGVRWSSPSTVSKVRSKGQSVLQTQLGPAGQSLAEDTSWVH